MPKSGRISIRCVADAAEVSIGTVSKALSGSSEISEATRLRVQRAALQLGYRPTAQARGLAKGRTGNIAVVVRGGFRPVFTSAFYSEVLAGVEAELERHDLNLLLTSLKRGDDLLRLASERRADGVLYIDYEMDGPFLRELSGHIPLVIVDGEAEGVSSVVSENLAGGRAAAEHLLARGCRRLAFIALTLEQPNFCMRYQGFREVLCEWGLEPPPARAAWTFAEVCREIKELLVSYQPDGIVCANDPVGYTALQALETLGVGVPNAVALVGYDGTAGAEHRKARLSTVALDKQEMGAAGVRLLLEQLEAALPGPPRQIVIPTRFDQGDTS